MFLLLRKGQFGEKLEKEVAIFLIFLLKLLPAQKTISYHIIKFLEFQENIFEFRQAFNMNMRFWGLILVSYQGHPCHVTDPEINLRITYIKTLLRLNPKKIKDWVYAGRLTRIICPESLGWASIALLIRRA